MSSSTSLTLTERLKKRNPTRLKSLNKIANHQTKGTTTESNNSGYKVRKELFKNSTERYFNIPIHSDLCTLRKYLPPNTKLEFEFHRSTDAFSLLTPNSHCNIIIEDIALTLSRYTPSNQIKKFHSDKLSSLKRQILPIDRSLIKTYT